MTHRTLGKTGFHISDIALGTWQVGGKWGSAFDHTLADRILREAIDSGINFIDTADVYGGGESEKAVGRAVRASRERIYVATKCGRQLKPHTDAAYTPAALRGFVEQSLVRMGLDCLDLVQLHCPPTPVYYRPEIFETFERLREEGKILHLGVSVEKVEEALKAIEFDTVTTVQIIYNLFRQRPHDLFFPRAAEKNVGIIVRVPLASGLLTGAYSASTVFAPGDHRRDNRQGEHFDRGETFAGIPYEVGLAAVDRVKALLPDQANLATMALRWVLMRPEVSCVIPGASRPEQVAANLQAANLPALSAGAMAGIRQIYEEDVKPWVHQVW
ncbi:MAG: aldo/keto reductase [Rhodothermales bacterium]|nr:aldo/keto reductase [Rhodothermales bacterium]